MKLTAETIQRDRELYDPNIDWLLNVAPSELGASGTLAGTISSLERGSQATGMPNTDPYSNTDVGWCVGDSPADKWRRLAPVWFRLRSQTQSLHGAHYSPIARLPEVTRARLEGALGKLAAAALWVNDGEKSERLLQACLDSEQEGRDQLIDAALRRTEQRVREAHREWREAMTDRSAWRTGLWMGYPMRRPVSCPQCDDHFEQQATAWARSDALPERCRSCGVKLREIEGRLSVPPAPEPPPVDDGMWDAAFQKRLVFNAKVEAVKAEQRAAAEAKAAKAIERACRWLWRNEAVAALQRALRKLGRVQRPAKEAA